MLGYKKLQNSTVTHFILIISSQEEEDLAYEEEILRNPYSVKCWSRYLEHKKSAARSVLNLVYERALKELPGR
jgi:pre-mRNA-splicing factor SYF1